MTNTARIGVFLCKCGEKIEPWVDLNLLKNIITKDTKAVHCEIMPFSCLKPGVENIIRAITEKGINRIIIAGCESRLMLKKMETMLQPQQIHKDQIIIINLRGHVAAVSEQSPEFKAKKAGKLIKAALADMDVLTPSNRTLAEIEGPVMIVGGGIASFTAAHELVQKKRDCFLSVEYSDADTIIRNIHKYFPGERHHYKRLSKIIKETVASPHVKFLPAGELTGLAGVTGDYNLKFNEKNQVVEYKTSAIIACMDADLAPPLPGFGYNGKTVMYQPEMEELIWQEGHPEGQIVFWVNDFEAGYPKFAKLSIQSAWSMAKYLCEYTKKSRFTILYNQQIPLPLSAAERKISQKLGILWIPYDPSVYPTLQDNYISFCGVHDHVEQEVSWDLVVLSPKREIGTETAKKAQILGLLHQENNFLSGHHARVRPDMVGREETYLAGSARFPCNLHEALTQGKNAATKTNTMMEKAEAKMLYVPRMVCIVDVSRCVGCGQCQELCDCGGIGVMDEGGGLPRMVDPMICMGGGTCAAACPYNALTLQNNTTAQREARVASLAKQLTPDEIMVFACNWGGLPAADNAANKGLKYDPRAYILDVPCVGQIDISVLARAFLEGSSGVILVGCVPEECHHSFGLDHAWSRINFIKKLLTLCGFDRRRIALAHADLNKPEEFIITIESFIREVSSLEAIAKNPLNQGKLVSMYQLAAFNSRIRYLLSASLRRAWEKSYRGDQRHGLNYDQDFADALNEEFLQTRILQLLQTEKRAFNAAELTDSLHEDGEKIGERLYEMAFEGMLTRSIKNQTVHYMAN